MEMLQSHHLLLNIFGDIDDKTYGYILNSLRTLELYMQNAKCIFSPTFRIQVKRWIAWMIQSKEIYFRSCFNTLN